MKKSKQLFFSGIIWLMMLVPVLAETGERTDDSMTLVYLFLGVCGLIIFLQLIPVFTLGLGLLKGLFSHKETHVSKYH
jgi:TctA family transporter